MKILIRSIILNKGIQFLLFVLITFTLKAQDTLTYSEFIDMVKSVHPTAQNASFVEQQGDLMVKSARGNFDPQLKSKYKEKFFQDKFYYRVFDAKLVIPTITGIDIVSGYGNNDGKFLNAENFTPDGGTGYLGVNIPLGKGLFTDENRTQLRLSQQQKLQKEALGQLMLNDLLLEASMSYWSWYELYNKAQNQEKAIQLAKDRFELVKNSFIAGELPGIDTMKAFVQLQERSIAYLSAKQLEVNAHWNLLTYFWDEDFYLRSDLVPEGVANTIIYSDTINNSNPDFWKGHPALTYYMTKYKSYEIERKLKIEKIKPKLDFEYKQLYNQVYPTFNGFGDNQYWGFNFSFPILLRQERAQLKISQLKIDQAMNDYKLKERNLANKLNSYEAEFGLINQQIDAQSVTMSSYEDLIRAETIKYRIGESTLFELNNWEQKMIKGQNKLFKLKSKRNMLVAKIAWVLSVWNT